MICFDNLIVQQYLFSEILLSVVLKCIDLFNCRLECNNMVLREIFVGKMEMLTGGWRK